MSLSPEEARKKYVAIGWMVVAIAFAIGFTCGNIFALLISLL